MPDLMPLFRPGIVAVVGASSRPGSFGGQVLRNLQSGGFTGDLFGVHPREREIYGLPAFPSLDELPAKPDCIALAVANRHLLGLLEQAAALGIPAAVLFGDPNTGPDRDPDLQAQISDFGRKHRILICGPNSMGLYNSRRRLAISGYPIRAGADEGNIALITHSGTVFDSLSQNNRSVHFNYLVSAGNEACLTAADYLEYVIADEQTRAAALYLESVRDPERFTRALEAARRKDIPVVVLKTGRSERGRRLAEAHSGALAGSAQTYEGVFRHFGACQVRTLDEMMDTLELFSRVRTVRSHRCSVLMESGGERSMLVDIAEDLGLALTEFSPETQANLAEIVEAGVPLANPLDAFGTGREVVRTYERCLQALDADPGTGLNLLAVDLARYSNLSPAYAEAALAAVDGLRNPLVSLVNVSSGAGEKLMAALRARGIPVLMGTETGLKAIRHLASFSQFDPAWLAAPPQFDSQISDGVRELRGRIESASTPLSGPEALQALSGCGLPVIRTEAVESLAQALSAAQACGYPVALKTAHPDVPHKTDVGGVWLDLGDPETLAAAYESLRLRLGPHALVQPMAARGVEMYFGMSRDPQFGPILLFGFGGIHLELYRDVVAALPALTEATAIRLLGMLKGFPMLEGFRGGPAADLDALAELMVRFAAFVRLAGDLLAEVDINPLVVTASGAQIVDALLVPSKN